MSMLQQIELRAKKILQKIEPWLIEPKPLETSHRLCLSLNGNILTLLHINNDTNGIEIILNENLEFSDTPSLGIVLTGVVKRYQLEHTPAYWLLAPDDYQLFFIDSIPVKGNEFKDALNWRLRSLLTHPIQETAVEYFMLPAKKSSSDQPMVVAVTSRKQQLADTIELFLKAGVQLANIDIPELALRNLSAACEKDEKSTAFLYFYKNMAILNVTRQKVLYFTRRIMITDNMNQNSPDFYEKLSLEILRYFDYFQSQWRHPSPSRFYIAAQQGNPDQIIAGLAKHLTVQLEPFPVSSIIVNKNKTDQLENDALLSLGSVLQQEDTNVKAEY